MNRRHFLKSASSGLLGTEGVGQVQPHPPEPTVRFTPGQGLTRISPHLYLLPDTCNVYVIKDGDHALLIDFGSGHILHLLGEAGVTRVERIIHTHHHRDQCQGDLRAVAERIPISVPAHERHLFEDAENFWRNRRVFHLYDVRNDFFTTTHNIPVDTVVQDYESVRWGSYEFLIFPTPGHTLGSICLVGAIDGKKVAFTGDLIHSPGKVVNLYDLQYDYENPDGVDLAILSLTRLRELGAELVCPSHGEPFSDPAPGIDDLIRKLRGWYEFYAPGSELTVDAKPFAVTPHLVASTQTTSAFYAIISDSGKALFVDYGSASNNLIDSFLHAAPVNDRIRFVEHTIPELKARFGLKSIDIAVPSHTHDDHLNGFPHLARRYGTKIWCYENMRELLENPRGQNVGCVLAEPVKVHRTFRHGESFKWEEFDFTMCHSPGHTEYQMALFVDIDGARVAFTGDAFHQTGGSAPYQLRHNLIFRNWVENDSHVRSIRTILEHEPTIVAPGHAKPFACNKADLDELKARLETQQRYFHSAVADPDCDFGLNPSWARLYPYQLRARAGAEYNVELRVRNYRSRPMDIEAALVLPAGWKASPAVLKLTAPARKEGRKSFILTIPESWERSRPRVAIAADIVADGRYLGEIAEGVVDIWFSPGG